MTLDETFKIFRDAGIKATPIPGTNKYHVSFRDGQSIYIREKILMRLARSPNKDPVSIIQTLKKLPTPQIP